MLIGTLLKEIRINNNFTLESFASQQNISKSYLSKIENNNRKPTDDILKAYSSNFGYNFVQLVDIRDNVTEKVIKVIDELNISKTKSKNYQLDIHNNMANVVLEDIPDYNQTKKYSLYNMDSLQWMMERKENSIHSIVTDPPYGIKEYTSREQEKLRNGNIGGVWRIPPSFDGSKRSPLPRFSILNEQDKLVLMDFFSDFAKFANRILVPGGHIFIASNPLLSHLLYKSIEDCGFEKRGEVIRLVQTLRGGDRPKNAHDEFSGVSVMPRSCWEPWGLFRKPLDGRVQDNLRKWKTGGLRRISDSQPFFDVIKSAPTNKKEKLLCPHPSLKPQDFMRQIVRASLPLGEGVILDPFMGGGSTIAAAEYYGYESIGVEIDKEYFTLANESIPKLLNYRKNIESSNQIVINF